MKLAVPRLLLALTTAAIFGGALHAADFPPYDGTKEREAFWSFYNKKVLAGLQGQEKELPELIAKEADAAKKAELEAQLTATRERLKKAGVLHLRQTRRCAGGFEMGERHG